MAEKQFILDLGKLVIAAAWADGELSTEEIHALKDLFFQVPDMTADDLAFVGNLYGQTCVTGRAKAACLTLLWQIFVGVKKSN